MSDKRGNLFILKFLNERLQLYRSSDFGEIWQHIVLPTSGHAYRVYVENDGNLIVPTSSNENLRDKILMSTDAGETWRELPFPVGAPLTVGRDATGKLLAGCFNGIYKYNDTDSDWSELNNGIHARRIDGIESTSTGSILVLSQGTCFRSTDYGSCWTSVYIGSPVGGTYPHSPILCTSGGNIFISAVFYDNSECGLLRSTDDGLSWDRISVPSNYYQISGITEGPSGDILISTYFGDIYRSTDKGDSWIRVVSSASQSEITCIASDKIGNYYAAKDTSILFSPDGIVWEVFSMKRNYYPHESMCIDTRGEIFLGSLFDGVYHSSDQARTWNLMNDGLIDKYVISTTADDSGNVVLGNIIWDFPSC